MRSGNVRGVKNLNQNLKTVFSSGAKTYVVTCERSELCTVRRGTFFIYRIIIKNPTLKYYPCGKACPAVKFALLNFKPITHMVLSKTFI